MGDGALAKAYARTGDKGRALLKSLIALLYEALEPGQPSARKTVKRYRSGLLHSSEHSSRSWFVLALAPEVTSGPQVLAALMPAVVRRIPHILVLRPRSRSSWPPAVLAALELCGVERVYSPPQACVKDYLEFLAASHGRGGLACLGNGSFFERMAAMAQTLGCGPSLWLEPPSALGIWTQPALEWNFEAMRFAHPQAALVAYGQGEAPGLTRHEGGPEVFRASTFAVVYAPAGFRPTTALVRLGPGLEAFWAWPHDFTELLERKRIVYSKD